jgi:hypothetical protein
LAASMSAVPDRRSGRRTWRPDDLGRAAQRHAASPGDLLLALVVAAQGPLDPVTSGRCRRLRTEARCFSRPISVIPGRHQRPLEVALPSSPSDCVFSRRGGRRGSRGPRSRSAQAVGDFGDRLQHGANSLVYGAAEELGESASVAERLSRPRMAAGSAQRASTAGCRAGRPSSARMGDDLNPQTSG